MGEAYADEVGAVELYENKGDGHESVKDDISEVATC